jgi:hypothetical protein
MGAHASAICTERGGRRAKQSSHSACARLTPVKGACAVRLSAQAVQPLTAARDALAHLSLGAALRNRAIGENRYD